MKTINYFTREELLSRNIGPETAKTFEDKLDNGFWARFASGKKILEIGYDGGQGCVPFLPHAIGVDKNYPGYDGITLPFDSLSQDTVYASHVYEHISDYRSAIREWYRVLKIGGFLIICVPHVWFYEKKADLPSNWNNDHKRFYAPGHLLMEVFESLPHLGYRVRHCVDNDKDWGDGWTSNPVPEFTGHNKRGGASYSAGNMSHSTGCYEIELVLEKTTAPPWSGIQFNTRRTLGRE
jgi:SAM-dependent methyltransferase